MVALKRTWGQQCCRIAWLLYLYCMCTGILTLTSSHALIYFRKISSYWLWLRTLNSNNANYYVVLIFTAAIHYFHHFELFCIAKFLLQIYKITLKTSGQYGNMNRLRIKWCSYFCLNIFSVVLCNISVNQQSFWKSK